MKSTLKIAFQSNMSPELPVIKVVQPINYKEGIFLPNEDHDVRDELISAFVSKPASDDHYPLYSVATSSPYPFENPTHWVTTIQPIQEQDVLFKLRHMVLNRLVSRDSILELNSMTPEILLNEFNPTDDTIGAQKYIEGANEYKKVHEFFDWIEQLPERNMPSSE